MKQENGMALRYIPLPIPDSSGGQGIRLSYLIASGGLLSNPNRSEAGC